jgi:hypothetical protein
MGSDFFTKFEYIKLTGDDGLPHDLLQIDIEKEGKQNPEIVGGIEFEHVCRVFVNPDALLKYLTLKQHA